MMNLQTENPTVPTTEAAATSTPNADKQPPKALSIEEILLLHVETNPFSPATEQFIQAAEAFKNQVQSEKILVRDEYHQFRESHDQLGDQLRTMISQIDTQLASYDNEKDETTQNNIQKLLFFKDTFIWQLEKIDEAWQPIKTIVDSKAELVRVEQRIRDIQKQMPNNVDDALIPDSLRTQYSQLSLEKRRLSSQAQQLHAVTDAYSFVKTRPIDSN